MFEDTLKAATLLYKLSAGSGGAPVSLWTGGPLNDASTLVLSSTTYKSKSNYVSRLASLWPGLLKASIRVYTNGTMKQYINFDIENTNINNFFQPSKIVGSSWTDIMRQFGTSSGDIFSMADYAPRQWYINQKWNGCPDDWGNLVVLASADGCNSQYFPNGPPAYPVIIYAPGTTQAHFGPDTAHADVFSIWADIPDLGLGDVPTNPAKGCKHIRSVRGPLPRRPYYVQFDATSIVPVLCDFEIFPGQAATMVYKINSGVAGDAINLLSQTVPYRDDASNIDSLDVNWAPTQYNSRLLAYWSTATLVSIRLYTGGVQNKFLTFNASGHTINNWFDHSNLLLNSWEDLNSTVPTNTGGGYFFTMKQELTSREWYINSVWGGCPADTGHLLVLSQRDDCTTTYFPNYVPTPNVIMYAPGTELIHATSYSFAETFIIWVVMDDIDVSKPGFSITNPAPSCTSVMRNSAPNNKARGYYYISAYQQPTTLALCDFTIWENRGAMMMFKVGNTRAIDSLYVWSSGDSTLPQNQVDIRNTTGNFRSPFWNIWNPQVMNARMSIYAQGLQRQYVDFKFTTASSTDNWYSPDYATGTSWTDLLPWVGGHDGEYFSMTGNYSRQWYLNANFGGCENDLGWFLVMPSRTEGCSWHYFDTLPWVPALVIGYADAATREQPRYYSFAESMVVWVDLVDDVCVTGANNCDGFSACTPTVTSRQAYTCQCPRGYSGTPPNSCNDIDECATNTNNCSPSATCTNTIGSFQCQCLPGFTGNGVNCTDINECDQMLDNCNPILGTCVNTPGSFSCQCNTGYTGDGRNCTDINECTTQTSNCARVGSTCTNTIGSFTCKCNSGYSGNGVNCSDINECTQARPPCDTNALCTNLPGSYNCSCKSGFSGNGVNCTDINECAMDTYTCDPNAACYNLPGSYDCTCMRGFTGNGKTCTDIDECALGTDLCNPHSACSNYPGGYSCGCQPGYTGTPPACTDIDECALGIAHCDFSATCINTQGNYTCACNPGYDGNGYTCQDINECANGEALCSPNALCTNTPGGYFCTCNPGWTGQNGFTCTDIDECALHTDNCGVNAICANTLGSFTCACKTGYSGDGITCTDINECVVNSVTCGQNAACVNGIGTYSCVCNSGYQGDGQTCTDIDECAVGGYCSPLATCVNTVGSADCTCKSGYVGDGRTCIDIDECGLDSVNPCPKSPGSICINTVGSYSCACAKGWRKSGTSCLDIDECAEGTANCTSHSTCVNKPGEFLCPCDPGFDGSGYSSCIDINECTNKSANCSIDATCKNTIGSYECKCNDGFGGDGSYCAVNTADGMPHSTIVIIAIVVTLAVGAILAGVAFYVKRRRGGPFPSGRYTQRHMYKEMDTSLGLLDDE